MTRNIHLSERVPDAIGADDLNNYGVEIIKRTQNLQSNNNFHFLFLWGIANIKHAKVQRSKFDCNSFIKEMAEEVDKRPDLVGVIVDWWLWRWWTLRFSVSVNPVTVIIRYDWRKQTPRTIFISVVTATMVWVLSAWRAQRKKSRGRRAPRLLVEDNADAKHMMRLSRGEVANWRPQTSPINPHLWNLTNPPNPSSFIS